MTVDCIPVLVALSRDHPDVSCRTALQSVLFNLIKHPDDEQRQVKCIWHLLLLTVVAIRVWFMALSFWPRALTAKELTKRSSLSAVSLLTTR